MTKKQKKIYLKNPTKCPYCESKNIIRNRTPKLYDGELIAQVECEGCESIWEDVYKVTDIKEILEVI